MSRMYSTQTGVIPKLGIVDYVLFALMFVASAAIGFYHAYRDRRKTDVKEFHFAGSKMHPIPVSLSLAATFFSAASMLGNPAEIYTHGTMYLWICAGMFIATIASAHFFMPVFFNLKKTSTFEYIEIRFNRVTRIFASIAYLIQTIIYMGFALYAPSLAFQAVTGISLWVTISVAAAVCTLYTTVGGMKTVLWTDSLQLSIMIAGLITVLVQSSNVIGGFSKAWDIADEGSRLVLTDFNFDLRTRHSVWSLGIGGAFFSTYLYGVNQAQIQRVCSLPSLRKAQVAVWMNLPPLLLVTTLTCLIGVTMFAFYKDCDPVKFGLIQKTDQMLPLMVLDILGHIPGLTGLFMASIFSGSLSTISSGLNAMSAVFLEDYLKQFCCKSLNGKSEVLVSKALVVILGLLQFGVTMAISQTSGLLMQLGVSMFSIVAGPLLGIFVSGLVFPWTNKYGAFTGLLVSLAIMYWLVIGAIVEKPSGTIPPLDISTQGCNLDIKNSSVYFNITTDQTTTIFNLTEPVQTNEPVLTNFYRISYQWYTGFGLLINLTVTLIVSFITGRTDPSKLDHRLMMPLFYKLFPCLPEKYRKYLLLGVNYSDKDKEKVGMAGIDNGGFDKEMPLKCDIIR